MESVQTKRIAELDGLRAFAVIAVVLYHMNSISRSLPRIHGWGKEVMAALGTLGVSIFFVISGFIITTLLLREKNTEGRVSIRAFYIRRFFRILPPFLVYLGVVLFLETAGVISIARHHLAWSALFMADTNLVPSSAWFVAHTWSLSVEEQFYLIFPPLLCVFFRFHRPTTMAALSFAYALSLFSLKLAHELSVHVHPGWINFAGLYHFRYIIVGVALALYGRPFFGARRLVPLALSIFILALRLVPFPSAKWSVLSAAIEPVLCGVFVMWCVQNPSRCSILRWPIVQWVGMGSYSIYLWQQLFTGSADYYRGWALAQSPWAAIAIVACAAASRYWIENPSIRLGRHLSKRLRGSGRQVETTDSAACKKSPSMLTGAGATFDTRQMESIAD